MTKTPLKCGLIEFNEYEQFVLFCSICQKSFEVPELFFSHVLETHISQKSPKPQEKVRIVI